jgi:O-antigen ligase
VAPPLVGGEGGASGDRGLRSDPVIGILAVAGVLAGLAVVLALKTTIYIVPAVPVGLVVVYVAVRRPVAALVVLQVVAWSGISGAIGTHSGFSLYTGMIVISLISLGLAVHSSGRWPFAPSALYLLVAAVAFTQALSLIASVYPIASMSTPAANLRDLVYFFVTLGLLRMTGRYRLTAAVVALTIGAVCALTLVQQYGLHNSTTFHGLGNIPAGADIGSATVRHSGPESDENFWGRTIVLAFGWCSAMILMARSAGRRVVWIVVALIFAGGEYLTSSRGGWVAFGAEVLVVIFIAFRKRPLYLLAVPLIVLVLTIAVPGVTSRLSTLKEVGGSSSSTDPSLLGRLQAQEVGLAMFKANPAFGVGVGNFIPVEPHYLGQPGIVQTGTLLAPHDLYLELLAEQGVAGFGSWLLLIGGTLVFAIRARALARRAAGDPRLDPVVGQALLDRAGVCTGTLVGLVFWSVASVVLHLSDFNLLLTFVAVAAGIDMDVRELVTAVPGVADPPPQQVPVPVTPGQRAALVGRLVAAPALAIVVSLAVALVVPPFHQRYQATATAAVYPNSDYQDAYSWYTVYGTTLLPTFASIAASPQFVADAEHRRPGALDPNVQVKASGQNSLSGGVSSNVVSVTVMAPHPQQASGVAVATLATARAYMASKAPYVIQRVASPGAVPTRQLDGRNLTIDLALAVLLIGGGLIRSSGTWRAWRRARRARDAPVTGPARPRRTPRAVELPTVRR